MSSSEEPRSARSLVLYSPELLLQICEHVSQMDDGKTALVRMARICQDWNGPALEFFRREAKLVHLLKLLAPLSKVPTDPNPHTSRPHLVSVTTDHVSQRTSM